MTWHDLIGGCDVCGKEIKNTDAYSVSADKIMQCEACSPNISAVIAQYKEILDTWDTATANFLGVRLVDIRRLMKAMEAYVEKNGDRKIFWFFEGCALHDHSQDR